MNAQVALHFLSAQAGACMHMYMVQYNIRCTYNWAQAQVA